MPYHVRRRLYTGNGVKSPYMHEVVPEVVTLRKKLSPFLDRKQVGINQTAFKEINIVPHNKTWTKPLKELLVTKIEKREVDNKTFARVMFDAMKSAIAEKWDSDKLHIVQHSSGWDSRLISLALVHLKCERGAKWLGDVVFVELGSETEQFRKIMSAEGWLPDQCYVYNEHSHPREHYAECFDFATAWRKLNGYCSYPLNLNWEPFVWLNREGIIGEPDQVQILTGYGANEIGNWVRQRGGFRPYLKFIYYHTLSHYCLWGGEENWIHPYLHLDYIKTWLKHSPGQPGNYRQLVVKQINPKLGKIRPLPKRVKMNRGYRRLSDRLVKQCQQDYRSSWFGQTVAPNVKFTNKLNYHPCWGYWSLASFCEHLRATGIEVKF